MFYDSFYDYYKGLWNILHDFLTKNNIRQFEPHRER